MVLWRAEVNDIRVNMCDSWIKKWIPDLSTPTANKLASGDFDAGMTGTHNHLSYLLIIFVSLINKFCRSRGDGNPVRNRVAEICSAGQHSCRIESERCSLW